MIHSQWLSSISYSVINYNHLAVLLGPQHLSTLKPEVCALWSASAPGSHHQTLCFCKFTFLDFTYKWYHIVSILLSSILCDQFSSLQLLSHVRLSETPWTAAHQTSLSITNSRSSLKLTCIESVMPSSHLILCHPLFLLPPIPPSIKVFSNESALRIRWPKYWSFSFSISPSNEYSGLICCFDLLAVQGALESLLHVWKPQISKIKAPVG